MYLFKYAYHLGLISFELSPFCFPSYHTVDNPPKRPIVEIFRVRSYRFEVVKVSNKIFEYNYDKVSADLHVFGH